MDVAEIASSNETAEVANASTAVNRDGQPVAGVGGVVENGAEETVGVIVPDENAMDEEGECEATDLIKVKILPSMELGMVADGRESGLRLGQNGGRGYGVIPRADVLSEWYFRLT